MRRPLILGLLLLAAGCGPRTTDDWLARLKDPDVVKKRQAIRELGSRTSEGGRIVPALADALRDADPDVRHDAATELGKFGPDARPAVPTLTAALKDKDAQVRKAAGEALKKIGPAATGKT